MKKMLSQGLLAAVLLSLTVPMAKAEMTITPSPNMNQPGVTTPGSSSQMNSTTTTTTTSQQVTAPMGNPVTASQEVVLGPFGTGYSSTLPQLNVIPNSNLQLTLVNPSPKPVTFSAPNINLNVVVPANSEKVVYIDQTMTAGLTPGQQVAYYINDASGNQLASSYIVSNQTIASQINTTTVSTADQQMAEKYGPAKTEPVAQEPASSNIQRQSTVRGFW